MGEDTSGIPSTMGGAHPTHVLITGNVGVGLHLRFRGRSCQVFMADLRVACEPGGLYTYPDIVALCSQPRYDESSNSPSLLNPQVIAEVLSPSTAAFDRGEKFMRYKVTRTLSQPTDLLRLASVDCEIPLAEIYDKVVFPACPAH